MARVEAMVVDITTLDVDAIVNAANSGLRGGGGVDGAIHRAAGPELLAACLALGGCPAGEVRLTPGYRLPARFVIHAVGPIWRGGDHGEAEILASCYRSSLEVARAHGFRSIAFPAISTGLYGYPLAPATTIAVKTVRRILTDDPDALDRVVFACFSEDTLRIYQFALNGQKAAQIRVPHVR
ncbi:MAG: O-acetyl-ADP-ribose deacetylase [Chloroflexi bacterium]|nr:O-acetyl-ADP-ribose deacetylase [Chloroflexota bacterium]